MFVFLDLEASGLINGYPTEVGWVRHPDRAEYSALIKLEADWLEYGTWDSQAEAITDITQDDLDHFGRPCPEVAAELILDLSGHNVFVDGGQHDAEWLFMITAPNVIPLEDFDGLLAAATDRGGWPRSAGVEGLEAAICRARAQANLPEHRALGDAKKMLISFERALAGPGKL